MNSSTHLLIEENVLRAAIDTHVIAEGELAEITRPCIQIKHLHEILLSLACAGLNHFALAEDKPNTLSRTAVVGGGYIELDHPMCAVLDRSREEFATGEVALSITVDKATVLDGEGEVCLLTQDMHMMPADEPIYQALLLPGQGFPVSNRIRVVEEANVEYELFKLVQGHMCILCISTCWVEGVTPAEISRLFPHAKNIPHLMI